MPIPQFMRIKPMSDIIQRFGLQYHCYADDTQLYFAIKEKDYLSF